MTITDESKIKEILSRGVEEVIDRDHLEKRLLSGEKLRIKFGIDPTGSLLHFGHAVVLRKLQQFMDLGHRIVLLIGDFTATIGDPSGRLKERPPLSEKEVHQNMKEYLKQAGKVLNVKKAAIQYNSKWYKKKKAEFFMDLSSKFTYSRLMDRAEFKKRIAEGGDVTLLELTYPLLQGYDSVVLKADLEIGGTDQKFNLLMGRKVQKRFGLPEQDIITVPLLAGTDGEKKMGKTAGNYIALMDSPDDMFAKFLTVPDQLVWQYALLLTGISSEEIKKFQVSPEVDIYKKKKELAEIITKEIYGEKAAKKARENFKQVIVGKQAPQEMGEFKITDKTSSLVDFVAEWLETSRTEAKRLISEKAVSVNDQIQQSWDFPVKPEDIVKVGPRRFVKAK